MKMRLMAMMAGLGLLMVLSGCIEVNQTVTVKKDGSGVLTDETLIGAQMLQMMAGFGGGAPGGADPLAKLYDEAQYKAKAAKYGEGVEYVKLEKIERNGGKGVKVHYKFADINTLKFEPGGGMDDMAGSMPGAQAAKVENTPWSFVFADGKLTITTPELPEGAEKPEIPAGGVEGIPPEAAMMFNGMRMSASLVIDSGIKKTNATHVEGNKITLMDIKMDQVMADPAGMKALQGVDMKDRKAMQAALQGVKGVKVEVRKTIEVQFN